MGHIIIISCTNYVDGKLVNNAGEPFKFDEYSSHAANQARYEDIGQVKYC